jgi:hypothetical protein
MDGVLVSVIMASYGICGVYGFTVYTASPRIPASSRPWLYVYCMFTPNSTITLLYLYISIVSSIL